jgi:hypothetical protein
MSHSRPGSEARLFGPSGVSATALAATRNKGLAEASSLVPSISSGLGFFRTKGD